LKVDFGTSNGDDVVMMVIVPLSFGIDGDNRKLWLAKRKQWAKI
jgi:hypothetical protein